MQENNETFIRIPYSSREEWLKMRGRGIGGSDVASILGISGWRSNAELWDEKVKPVEEETFEDDESENECIIYGKTCEDAIRTLFQAKLVGLLLVTHTDENLVRKDKPYLRASLDAELVVLKDFIFKNFDGKEIALKQGMKGILEIKTKLNPKRDEWKVGVPNHYMCQGVHYINVTNWDFVIYLGECRYTENANSSIRAFCYLANDPDFIEDRTYVESEVDKFWNKVQKKERETLKFKLPNFNH